MNIGNEIDRNLDWVSKTQLMRYLRCPYYFWLVESGQITDVELENPVVAARIEQGNRIHQQVSAAAKPLVVELNELPNVMAEQALTLLDLPVFTNDELMIRGQPDGIVTAEGVLFPLEIKTRKDRKACDKIELAFYWLLLEPYRTRKAEPLGYLWLRGIGVERNVEIKITEQIIEEVHQLLTEVRRTRKEGAEPRYHNCPYCNGVNREASLQASNKKKDISLIRGVGPVTLRRLEKVGIRTYDQLKSANEFDLLEKIRAIGGRASLALIRQWKQHANSYQENRPVVFGKLPEIGDAFIALDLEYLQHVHIWLIGIAIVRNAQMHYEILWSDDQDSELSNLRTLIKIIEDNKDLQVITWNGKVADIPQIESATFRYPDLASRLAAIKDVHLDLFWHASQSIRFPIPEFGLHHVAAYYHLPQSTEVSNGLEACFLFQQYQQMENSSEKAEIKKKLIDYSRLDLEALVNIVGHIKLLSCIP